MKQETNFPDLLTAQEARKLLRLGKNAIYDLARDRKLERNEVQKIDKALFKLIEQATRLREKIKKEVEL